MAVTTRLAAAELGLFHLLEARAAIGGSPLEGVPLSYGFPGDQLAAEHMWIGEEAEARQEWQITGSGSQAKTEIGTLEVWIWVVTPGNDYPTSRDRGLAMAGEVERAVQSGIAILQDKRDRDPRRGVLRRLRPGREEDSRAESDARAVLVAKAFEAWNESGPEGVARWMADSVRLVDPPRWPGSDYRMTLIRSERSASLAVMTRVLAWKARWVLIRSMNSWARSTLSTSLPS